MRPAIKSKWLLILGLSLIVAPIFLSAPPVQARCDAIDPICGGPGLDGDTRPYFKVLGGDIFAGGWFENVGGSCNVAVGSNYQDPFYKPSDANKDLFGGIQTFAKKDGSDNSAGGSSTQFGAFSLGSIDGDSGVEGHYSAGAAASSNKKLLSFGNYAAAGDWGGFFQGATRQSHCIPDYYDLKKPVATSSLDPNNFASQTGNKDYLANLGGGPVFSLNNLPVTIGAGSTITVFVPGSVYIGANIVNSLDSVDNVPKFALVAKGNIYIGKNVTQLDGWYIAQPADPDNAAAVADDGGGVIWTCHDANNDPVLDTYPNSCTNKLVVNGALTAKDIKFLRTGSSDVSLATTAEDGTAADHLSAALASPNISEIINYTPAMVIGGQFFNESQNPTTTNSYQIESLVNLPPIF